MALKSQLPQQQQQHLQQKQTSLHTRRSILLEVPSSFTAAIGTSVAAILLTASTSLPLPAQADDGSGSGLKFSTAKSGLQWADAKVGSGPIKQKGEMAAVDYVLSTTGARYGTKIYSTKDLNNPYRWRLGDGTTIQGIEEAILGGEGIPPMQPGGIRRIIIPSNLAYENLAVQVQNCQAPTVGGKEQPLFGPGPIPPPDQDIAAYQRFKNIYCNPNRQYQPDVVMDLKLYGRRN